MTRLSSKRDDKAELDFRLEKELEETFPASDPLKITRFPIQSHRAAPRQDTRNSTSSRDRMITTPTEASERSGDSDNVRRKTPMAADHIKLKRAYDPPASNDGTRILIDRLWPRGLRKADANVNEWMKEIAPSTTLRKWFGHRPERWPEFRRRYRSEIEHHPEQFGRLRALAERGHITLVFAAHDEAHNDSVVLKEMLLSPTSCALK